MIREKWEPVFRKDNASPQKIERQSVQIAVQIEAIAL
jgi:hypothetical protein